MRERILHFKYFLLIYLISCTYYFYYYNYKLDLFIKKGYNVHK